MLPDGSGQYATLAEAVAAAPAGATIHLAPGVYRLDSPLDISRPLNLLGAGMENTQIVAQAEGYVLRYAGAGLFFQGHAAGLVQGCEAVGNAIGIIL